MDRIWHSWFIYVKYLMSVLFCEIVFDMMKIISDHLQSVNYK